MPVKEGDTVVVEYEGKLENGEIFDSSSHGDHHHPLEFVVGSGNIIKGFDEGVRGMEIGEEKEISINPDEAYGERKEELQQKVPKSELPPLPEGQELKEGMVLALNTPQGQFPAKISKVEEDSITIDLNHPLAGKKLFFKIKLLEIK